MVDVAASDGSRTTGSGVADLVKPAFISDEVWQFAQLAAKQNKLPVQEYIERALLDEAIILEQVRFGRQWLVKNKKGETGEVDFT